MSGRVSGVLDELETKLKAIYVDPSQPISFGRGAKAIAPHGTPPRIVWVSVNGKFGPAEKATRARRRIATRIETVVAHCWGSNFDATEQLLHDLLTNLHQAAFGSYELMSTEWPAEHEMQLGNVVYVSFALRIPVEETTRPRIKATSIELEGSIETGPSVLQTESGEWLTDENGTPLQAD